MNAARLSLVAGLGALAAVALWGTASAIQGDPVPGADVSAEESPGPYNEVMLRTDRQGTAVFTSRKTHAYTILVGPLKPVRGQPARAQVSMSVDGARPVVQVLALPSRPWRSAPFQLKAGARVVVKINYAPG